jgi:hypothetical protein
LGSGGRFEQAPPTETTSHGVEKNAPTRQEETGPAGFDTLTIGAGHFLEKNRDEPFWNYLPSLLLLIIIIIPFISFLSGCHCVWVLLKRVVEAAIRQQRIRVSPSFPL